MSFRLEVTSSDGVACSVNVPLKLNRERPYKNTLNQIADIFRVEREQIEDVLKNWTREQLREHLGRFSHAELKRPNLR